MTIPTPVANYIRRVTRGASPLHTEKLSSAELKSFGVFLGGFSNPPTPAQARLLSQWDVVVLNPLESGVFEALSSHGSSSVHRLGRLNVRTVAKSTKSMSSDEIIAALGMVINTITKCFNNPQGSGSPYTGVLLADFIDHFQPPVLNELVKYIDALGLGAWLEVSAPDFLPQRQCRDINFGSIAGIVYRNGTIRTDGDRQNFHQMAPMRATQRAVAAQRVPHGPPMMLWETIHDEFHHQYAVTARSFNWCRFNSALPWIGSSSALNDAEAATTQSITEKPLGALMWLKDDNNMNAHNIWRANDKVSDRDQNCASWVLTSHDRSPTKRVPISTRMIPCMLLFPTSRPSFDFCRPTTHAMPKHRRTILATMVGIRRRSRTLIRTRYRFLLVVMTLLVSAASSLVLKCPQTRSRNWCRRSATSRICRCSTVFPRRTCTR